MVDQIQENYLNGELKPGDKLPTERELASLFNISRTSVREALRKLKIDGFIEIKQGSGSFIKLAHIRKAGDELSSSILDAEINLIYEMLDLRRVLEVECVHLASQKASSEDLARIREALQMMNQAKDDEASGLQADISFHLNIVRASHNSIYIKRNP
ncbi:FadR/GntR family transcriptional regulator [Peribacillus acanthi]|uniref:FadR/GntR family transcriptional regulator n=1 Tax=Peribacillus acanthi TaxID=2171554 RepID=UPI0023E88A38|nr:FadR/GntR family transcriptional regulator [Peribacillus acanthi]